MQQGKKTKRQRPIAAELARRGITQEQAKRVKKLYEQQNGSADKDANATVKIGTVCVKRQRRREDIYVTEILLSTNVRLRAEW